METALVITNNSPVQLRAQIASDR